MKIANVEIRNKIKKAKLCHWMVAHKIGIADTTFSRWLRFELPDKEKRQILSIIDEFKK